MNTKKLKAGEHLFKEGDIAQDFYLLQNGQLRLYQSKGKGFVELGIMRSGDLIGEATIGEEQNLSEPRNYSAEAIGECELIVVSIEKFRSGIKDNNGGVVKIVFNALSNKLKKSLQKIKEFEQNSLSYGEGEYVFIKDHEVGKILSMIYLVGTTFGIKEEIKNQTVIKFNRKMLQIYASDIFGLAEAKIESIFTILKEFKVGAVDYNSQEGTSTATLTNVDLLKNIINFYQAERFVPDDKKVKVSQKCLTLLEKLYFKIIDGGSLNKTKDPAWSMLPIDDVLEFFKERNLGIEIEEFIDAKKIAVTREIMINAEGKQEVEIHIEKLKKYLPILKFQHAIKKLNATKTKP